VSPRAVSPFNLDSFDGDSISDTDGVGIGRAQISKTFTGDLVGTGVVEMLTTVCGESGSRAYVAMERIEGTLAGRTGSFVLHHSATATASGQSATWTVVPDSGTGELAGITGTGDIAIAPDGSHTFTLDYDLS
jgi:hypothetical protein